MRRAGLAAALLTGACLSSPPAGGGKPDAAPAADGSPEDAGLEIVEEIEIPSDCKAVTSDAPLDDGLSYQLIASGVIVLADGVEGDAEYFWSVRPPPNIRTGTADVDMGVAIDDLVIDAIRAPDWGAYRSDHRYEVEFIGTGAPINVQFHDSGCANNDGTLWLAIALAAGG